MGPGRRPSAHPGDRSSPRSSPSVRTGLRATAQSSVSRPSRGAACRFPNTEVLAGDSAGHGRRGPVLPDNSGGDRAGHPARRLHRSPLVSVIGRSPGSRSWARFPPPCPIAERDTFRRDRGSPASDGDRGRCPDHPTSRMASNSAPRYSPGGATASTGPPMGNAPPAVYGVPSRSQTAR